MKTTRYIAAAICCLMMLFTSCGTKKTAPKEHYEANTEIKSEIGSLAASYTRWKDVSMPVKLEMKQPKNLSISGKAYMVHGKSVHLSLRFLGLELGSVYVDNDSVYVIAKMQRMAYTESLNFFRRSFGFTLDDIQSLILGQAFVPGKGTLTTASEREFKVSRGENAATLVLTPTHTPKNVSWHFEASKPEDKLAAIIEALVVYPNASKPLTAVFKEQKETGAGMAAEKVELSSTMGSKKLQFNVVWNFGRSEWNKGIEPAKPEIPSNYKRLTTKGLAELLKKL